MKDFIFCKIADFYYATFIKQEKRHFSSIFPGFRTPTFRNTLNNCFFESSSSIHDSPWHQVEQIKQRNSHKYFFHVTLVKILEEYLWTGFCLSTVSSCKVNEVEICNFMKNKVHCRNIPMILITRVKNKQYRATCCITAVFVECFLKVAS